MSRFVIEDRNVKINFAGIKPSADHVLVETLEKERTKGGIFLPSGEQTECFFGKVLKVGEGTTNTVTGEVYPLDVKPGEFVLSMKYMGQELEVEGKAYKLIREHGIWARLALDPDAPDLDIREITPRADCVVLEVAEEYKLRSGLYLPGDPKTQCATAKVLKVGPGYRNLKSGAILKPALRGGEQVIVRRYAGAILKVRGEDLRIVQERDILSILEG